MRVQRLPVGGAACRDSRSGRVRPPERAPAAGSAPTRSRASSSITRLQLGVLVRVPAVEELSQPGAPDRDEPFVARTACIGQRQRLVRLGEALAAQLVERAVEPGVCRRHRGDQLGSGERRPLAEARQQPERRRPQVELRPLGAALVHLPSLVAPRQQRERALDLAQAAVVVRGVEPVAHVRRLRGRLQRHLAQQPRQHEGEQREAGRDEEDRRAANRRTRRRRPCALRAAAA